MEKGERRMERWDLELQPSQEPPSHPSGIHPIPSLRLLPGRTEELGWEGGEISWELLVFPSKREGSELK